MSLPPIVPPIRQQQHCPHCLGGGFVIDQYELGQMLRKRRELLGASLTVAAVALGISKSYLSDLEYGRRDWLYDLYLRYVRWMAELERSSVNGG